MGHIGISYGKNVYGNKDAPKPRRDGHLFTNFHLDFEVQYRNALQEFKTAHPECPIQFEIKTDAYDACDRLMSNHKAIVWNYPLGFNTTNWETHRDHQKYFAALGTLTLAIHHKKPKSSEDTNG